MQQNRMQDLLNTQMKLKGVKSCSLIVQNNDRSFIYNYGDSSSNNRIGNNSLFQIGSITKIFTALLVNYFVKNNSVSLSTELGEVLLEKEINDSIKSITILELLTHTSGLPRLPDNFMDFCIDQANPYLFYGEKQLLAYLHEGKIQKNNKMVYSNVGYGLLGYLLEQMTGLKYKELLQSIIFHPLGLKQTLAYDESYCNEINCLKGFNLYNEDVPMWDMNVMKAAGCIVSSPHDMKIVLASIVMGNSSIEDIVAQSIQPLNKQMAWGWFKKDFFYQLQNDGCTLWHNGMTGGFSSFMQVNKKNKKGFVLLLNKSIGTEFIIPEIEKIIKESDAFNF